MSIHVESSVLPLSPPNTYSYLQEYNLGSTRKFVKNFLLYMCMSTKHILELSMWLDGETFLRQLKIIPSAYAP